MKECTHCGGPNAPENRVCDYCGMGFSEDTIPEGSTDPREQARLDAEAWKEANREKDLIEFNLSGRDDQNVAINLPDGQIQTATLELWNDVRGEWEPIDWKTGALSTTYDNASDYVTDSNLVQIRVRVNEWTTLAMPQIKLKGAVQP